MIKTRGQLLAEIERLRCEMVLAMADCETAAHATPTSMRKALRDVAARIKAALEKP